MSDGKSDTHNNVHQFGSRYHRKRRIEYVSESHVNIDSQITEHNGQDRVQDVKEHDHDNIGTSIVTSARGLVNTKESDLVYCSHCDKHVTSRTFRTHQQSIYLRSSHDHTRQRCSQVTQHAILQQQLKLGLHTIRDRRHINRHMRMRELTNRVRSGEVRRLGGADMDQYEVGASERSDNESLHGQRLLHDDANHHCESSMLAASDSPVSDHDDENEMDNDCQPSEGTELDTDMYIDDEATAPSPNLTSTESDATVNMDDNRCCISLNNNLSILSSSSSSSSSSSVNSSNGSQAAATTYSSSYQPVQSLSLHMMSHPRSSHDSKSDSATLLTGVIGMGGGVPSWQRTEDNVQRLSSGEGRGAQDNDVEGVNIDGKSESDSLEANRRDNQPDAIQLNVMDSDKWLMFALKGIMCKYSASERMMQDIYSAIHRYQQMKGIHITTQLPCQHENSRTVQDGWEEGRSENEHKQHIMHAASPLALHGQGDIVDLRQAGNVAAHQPPGETNGHDRNHGPLTGVHPQTSTDHQHEAPLFFPSTEYMIRRYLSLDRDDFDRRVVCPNSSCGMTYELETARRGNAICNGCNYFLFRRRRDIEMQRIHDRLKTQLQGKGIADLDMVIHQRSEDAPYDEEEKAMDLQIESQVQYFDEEKKNEPVDMENKYNEFDGESSVSGYISNRGLSQPLAAVRHSNMNAMPRPLTLKQQQAIRDRAAKMWLPIHVQPYRSMIGQVGELLQRPEWEDACDHWRPEHRTPHPNIMFDVHDGQIWSDYQMYNEKDMLKDPNTLAWALHVDWVQPFKRVQYSTGMVYLACLNLPRHIRYKKENLVLVSLLPVSEKWNLNHLLKPLVDELKKNWDDDGYFYQSTARSPNGRRVRCVLIAVICDIPASRKVGGFKGVGAYQSCNRCKKVFPRRIAAGSGRPVCNFGGFDSTTWSGNRNGAEHRRQADEVEQANGKTKEDLMQQVCICGGAVGSLRTNVDMVEIYVRRLGDEVVSYAGVAANVDMDGSVGE